MILISIIPPLTYLLINIAHAKYHAYLADVKNKVILSRQKVFEYSIASIAMFFIFISWYDWLPLILLPLFTRVAVFDPCLNLFRGKSWLYEGQISKKKSVVDWIENLTGLPVWVFRIAYLLIYVGYLIYYFI